MITMYSMKSFLSFVAILACNSGSMAFAFQSQSLPSISGHRIVTGPAFLPLRATEGEDGVASKETPPAPPVIDVSKLDIRVGLIEKCWEHEEADKLFCEEIDVGEEDGPRQIASGLKAYYSAEEMVGKKVLVLANLKTRKMVGFPSHGMVLCAVKEGAAEDGSEDQVELLSPPEGSNPGDRIVCEGFQGEPATENQVIKKKMLNVIFPDLKVNSDGVAVYKGVPLTTEDDQPCTSTTLKDVIIS